MPWSEEITRSIYALWRILKFDVDAVQYFNLTSDGFWRSFLVAGLGIPVVALLLLPMYNYPVSGEEKAVDLTAEFIGEIIGSWLLLASFPVLMIWITRLLNLSRNYVPFIIGWNWSIIASIVLLAPLSLLFASGLPTRELLGMAHWLDFTALMFFTVLVNKTCLDCTVMTAIGILVLEFVIAVMLDLLVGVVI